MHSHFKIFRQIFTTKLGHCTTCMRHSLAAGMGAWAVYGIGLVIWPGSLAHSLSGILAIALTCLWMAHIAAYAAKPTAKGSDQGNMPIENIDRRGTLGLMLRAVGIGVVASVPALLWPSAALAFCGQCTRSIDCGSGWSCKNTAAVNSGKVCNECIKD